MSPTSSESVDVRPDGVMVEIDPQKALAAIKKVLPMPDRRLWTDVNGPVKGKYSASRYRNERCFCGSGKKFKHCHLNQKENDNAVGEKREDNLQEDIGGVGEEANRQERGQCQEGAQPTALEDRGIK